MRLFRSLRAYCAAAALLAALSLPLGGTMAEDTAFAPLSEGANDVLPIDLTAGYAPSACESETLYTDSSISVRIENYDVAGTNCIVAYVRIADPSQLRTAPAYDFRRGQVASTESIANRMRAVAAINGDFYSYWREIDGGYMVRQGVEYSSTPILGRDLLLIDDKGDFHIVAKSTKESVEAALKDRVIVNSLNFGPGLVVDGEVLSDEYESEFCQSHKRHQRAAIGQMKNGSLDYVLAVCEGSWMREDAGLTIAQFAHFLKDLGVEQAYNLDGGNSTALIFGNQKINEKGNPHHRELSDIIYFASAAQANKE